MTQPIHIKENVEFLPPIISEEVALKLWQRMERNPCKDEAEQALYDALTKRFFTLASACFLVTEETTPEKPLEWTTRAAGIDQPQKRPQ